MAKKPHMFITRSTQNIQEINRHYDGTLNHFGAMVFTANQEQNESYTLKEILLQPYRLYFILAMIKEVEAHEYISHWKFMENSGVQNKHKNKYGKIKTILSIWHFKNKIFSYGRFMKHK